MRLAYRYALLSEWMMPSQTASIHKMTLIPDHYQWVCGIGPCSYDERIARLIKLEIAEMDHSPATFHLQRMVKCGFIPHDHCCVLCSLYDLYLSLSAESLTARMEYDEECLSVGSLIKQSTQAS